MAGPWGTCWKSCRICDRFWPFRDANWVEYGGEPPCAVARRAHEATSIPRMEAAAAPLIRMNALIVRFSAIGDCVMAVPVAAAIREKYPDAHISWAIEPRCSAVLDTERLINEVLMFPRDDWESRRWSPSTWASQLRTYMGMRKRRYDLGIDLHGQAKTALCLRIAKPAIRIGVRPRDAITRRLNPVVPFDRGDLHTVEYNLKALAELGSFSQQARFVMPALKAERAKVRGLLPEGRPLATIAISAGQPRKAYPVDSWKVVAEALLAKGYQVAFLGGPGDPPSPVEDALDLVGKLSLGETMAAVAESAIHLAADTGTGHMAAAYGVPVVSVFGGTQPKTFRPYTTRGVVLDGKTSPSLVAPAAVIEAVEGLLGA